MGSKGAERGRWAWEKREHSQTAECSGSASNWSSALVEDILETNIIGHRNMVVLKELDYPGTLDPGLLSDLRHDKNIRSSVYPSKLQQPHSAIMLEAKRNLKREEKVTKNLSLQNKMVDEEVDRFQSHIKSLRKMNQRLERIAFPISTKKRLGKLHPGPNTTYHHKDYSPLKVDLTEDKLSIDQGKSKKRNPNSNAINATDNYGQRDFRAFQSKPKLSISGNKMEEHEIFQHPVYSLPCRISNEHQNTVFERIHEKYIESERKRVMEEGTVLIRHSSPINDCEQNGHSHSITSTTQKSMNSQDSGLVQIGDWIEDLGLSDVSEAAPNILKTEVSINEWNTSSKSREIVNAAKLTNSEIKKPLCNTLPPATGPKKGDHNKLESMSKMYAKWMTKVCAPHSTKFEDTGCKTKPDKTKEGELKRTNVNTITREEKIMQVLQALQKHKDTKPEIASMRECTSSSRFSKSVNDVREDKLEPSDHKFRRAISGSYEQRLKAHKELITHQKAKLDEQKRQIDDLKLSQLRMESEKSQIQTHRALNEVMQNCNVKVKAQAKSLKSSLSLVDLSPGNDFVLRMEQRALEQKQKKFLAQERRKQFEEERKKRIKELEEKRRQEEEETLRRKQEEALDMRRKEREMREEARKEREKYIALERKADHFCRTRRLRHGLFAFKKLLLLRKKQEEIADVFYERYLMQNSLKVWRKVVEMKLAAKLDYADNFFSVNLLQRCFNALKLEMQESTRYMQVAVDMHDFRLQEHYFNLWLKITHNQQEVDAEKTAKANSHFHSVLLRKCLLQWRKYPKVAQLEREKERRKMVWRNKVQQLLPDFRPMLSLD